MKTTLKVLIAVLLVSLAACTSYSTPPQCEIKLGSNGQPIIPYGFDKCRQNADGSWHILP